MKKLQFAFALYISVFFLYAVFPREIPVVDVIHTEEDVVQEVVINPEDEELIVLEKIPLTRVSAYNPVPRQTWGDPNIASCGPNLERQVAVSRDIFFDSNGAKHLCGTLVTVVTERGEIFEEYVIWDTMHPRYTSTVDIMIPTTNESEAFAFGVTTGKLLIHGKIDRF